MSSLYPNTDAVTVFREAQQALAPQGISIQPIEGLRGKANVFLGERALGTLTVMGSNSVLTAEGVTLDGPTEASRGTIGITRMADRGVEGVCEIISRQFNFLLTNAL